jgi:hypothetical protein
MLDGMMRSIVETGITRMLISQKYARSKIQPWLSGLLDLLQTQASVCGLVPTLLMDLASTLHQTRRPSLRERWLGIMDSSLLGSLETTVTIFTTIYLHLPT